MFKNHHLTRLSQGLIIREAEENDFPLIWAIYQKVLSEGTYTSAIRGESALDRYEHLSQDEVDKRKALTLLAEVDGKLVGYISIDESIWDLSRHVGELGIAVLPEFRGVGVGSALMESALHLASEKGFKKIGLSVFHTNKRAINLYRKFRFKKVGRKRKQFNLNGEYIDEITMEKFVD
nr:GNAT family N-acetyltransferase [Candidatus Njordarchaeum guaymaensis]